MPQGRRKWLAVLACAAGLVVGRAWAEEPSQEPAPATEPFAVLPTPAPLLTDAPAEAPHPDTEPACAESQPHGLFLAAEYLLLKPQRGDLDYAILNATRSGHPDGTVETLVLPTVSSFRVEAGYRFPGQWDAGLAYSYLFSHGQRSVVSDPGGTIYTTMTSPGGGIEQAASAQGDVRLNYNVGDLEIGRRLQFGDQFSVRVFGGGRAGFINQHVVTSYNGRDANNAVTFTRVDFDGAGVRVGGEGVWNIGRGFNLFAFAAGSLLEGRYGVNQGETNGTATLLDVSDKFEKIVPVTEYGMGVGWERNNIRVRISYEMTNWSNLVDRVDFVDDVHRGKLVHNLSDLHRRRCRIDRRFAAATACNHCVDSGAKRDKVAAPQDGGSRRSTPRGESSPCGHPRRSELETEGYAQPVAAVAEFDRSAASRSGQESRTQGEQNDDLSER